MLIEMNDQLMNVINSEMNNLTAKLGSIPKQDKEGKALLLKKIKILQNILHQLMVLKTLSD